MSDTELKAAAKKAVAAWKKAAKKGEMLPTPGWRPVSEVNGLRAARLGRKIDHEHLLAIVVTRPGDYWSHRDRNDLDGKGAFGADCSSGCKWYATLDGELGGDWGVCCSVKSQRCGLLTFEHQGCEHFEWGGEE